MQGGESLMGISLQGCCIRTERKCAEGRCLITGGNGSIDTLPCFILPVSHISLAAGHTVGAQPLIGNLEGTRTPVIDFDGDAVQIELLAKQAQ